MRQAIINRKSRRCYLGEPLAEDDRLRIEKLIAEANRESGLNFSYIEDASLAFANADKTYGLFSGVVSIIALKGPKADENLLEKAGYYGEKIVLHATDMGLGSCWVGGSFDRDKVEIGHDEKLPAVITIGYVEEELTVHERDMKKRVGLDHKTGPEMLVADLAWEDLPDWLREGMTAVSLAPSARNTQKAEFSYEDGRLTASIANDYRMDMVDLGIAKLHFEIGGGGSFDWGNGAELTKK